MIQRKKKKDLKWSLSAYLQVDIAHRVSDHLLWNRACYVFNGFFQLINGHWLSSSQVNHDVGIYTEEIIKGIEVGAVWGLLDPSFAADDVAPKLCVEEPHDFRHCVACRAIPVAVLTNYSHMKNQIWSKICRIVG